MHRHSYDETGEHGTSSTRTCKARRLKWTSVVYCDHQLILLLLLQAIEAAAASTDQTCNPTHNCHWSLERASIGAKQATRKAAAPSWCRLPLVAAWGCKSKHDCERQARTTTTTTTTTTTVTASACNEAARELHKSTNCTL